MDPRPSGYTPGWTCLRRRGRDTEGVDGVGNEGFPPPQPSGSAERRELPSGVRVVALTENGKRVSVLFKRPRMFLVEMFVVN